MPDLEPTHLLRVTAELAAAYVVRNHIRSAELPNLIVTVHETLSGLAAAPETAPSPKKLIPRMPIKKTVSDTHIVSLEDGKSYKTLKRHLAKRGLTPEAYRAKWGLPHDYPMVAPAYGRQRSEMAKTTGLGSLRRKR